MSGSVRFGSSLQRSRPSNRRRFRASQPPHGACESQDPAGGHLQLVGLGVVPGQLRDHKDKDDDEDTGEAAELNRRVGVVQFFDGQPEQVAGTLLRNVREGRTRITPAANGGEQ